MDSIRMFIASMLASEPERAESPDSPNPSKNTLTFLEAVDVEYHDAIVRQVKHDGAVLAMAIRSDEFLSFADAKRATMLTFMPKHLTLRSEFLGRISREHRFSVAGVETLASVFGEHRFSVAGVETLASVFARTHPEFERREAARFAAAVEPELNAVFEALRAKFPARKR